MADSLNSGGNKPQELSMEMRLLLAFVLMGVVMWISQTYFAPPPKKAAPPAAATPTSPSPIETAKTNPAAPETPAATAPAPAPNATAEKVEPAFVVQTNLYRIVINNQGATVRSWQLKKFKGSDGKPLDLVNGAAGLDFPFSLYFTGAKPSANVNWVWYKQTGDPDGLG